VEVEPTTADQVLAADRLSHGRRACIYNISKSPHQQVDGGGDDDGGEPAEVAVGEEAAEQGHERGDAHPVVGILGGHLHLLLQHLGEVDHEARGYAEVAQPLAELDHCGRACVRGEGGGS
jgi:hypothetical protein